MDHITIPIPDGIDERQKADLTGWLTHLAQEATGGGEAVDDDPAVRAEIDEKIRRGMADIEAGRVIDARVAMRQIADEFGIHTAR